MPWQKLFNAGWRIVGMNHYRMHGTPHLFCSMAKEGRCITAENTDETQVFRELERLAGISNNSMESDRR
jgi:hypothetical protein